MIKPIYIYTLSCPITGFVKYVGKTVDPKTRLRKHITAKKQAATSKWIFSLKDRGLLPIFEIIDETDLDNWQQMEIRYIKLFKSFGAPILNHTIGGEGGNTMGGRKLTIEQSKKISDFKLGRPNPATGTFNKLNKGIKVDQFDLKGNYIATHLSIIDAGKAIGRCSRPIQFMVKNKPIKNGWYVSHVGGFIFKYAK